AELGRLNLVELALEGNPFPEPLASLVAQGQQAVLAHLRSLLASTVSTPPSPTSDVSSHRPVPPPTGLEDSEATVAGPSRHAEWSGGAPHHMPSRASATSRRWPPSGSGAGGVGG